MVGNEYVVGAECPNFKWRAERVDDLDFSASAQAICKLTAQACPVMQGRNCVNVKELSENGLKIIPKQVRHLAGEEDEPVGTKTRQKKGKNESLRQHYTNEPVVILLGMLAKYWESPLAPYVVYDPPESPGL